MAANNQGIMHLSWKQGGLPLCRNQRAHMSATPDSIKQERVCAKCQRALDAMRQRKAEKAAPQAAEQGCA